MWPFLQLQVSQCVSSMGTGILGEAKGPDSRAPISSKGPTELGGS